MQEDRYSQSNIFNLRIANNDQQDVEPQLPDMEADKNVYVNHPDQPVRGVIYDNSH
jgi:hypothetical protein